MMLPNNKIFVVWILDGLGLCEDVIRWGVLMWLVDWEKVFVKIFGEKWRKDLGKCFTWSCKYGQLDVVKWLWEVSERNIDIHANNEAVFILSCEYGQLDVVKWLWEVSERNIDIYADDEAVFRICYEYGHLDIAKWLWKVSDGGIDIHVGDNMAFKVCCYHGYVNIMKWLWEVSDGKMDLDIDYLAPHSNYMNTVNYLKSIGLSRKNWN